ncbi:hypothetical protein P9578_28235 [Brevibacillus choshinensis]|nr:hypothetical protein [Brevibacillus choshinensis]
MVIEKARELLIKMLDSNNATIWDDELEAEVYEFLGCNTGCTGCEVCS